LDVAFKVLHHFNMAEKNMLLSAEELDLVEFLVAQVASLSCCLAVKVEVVGEAAIAEALAPPSVACEVTNL
jgi:hypothetical protein